MEAELEVETDYEDYEMVGGFYVGSTTSNKYHRPDCRYAEKIKDENKIFFSDAEEAEEAGYSPCKVCNPE
jgi:competence protein ComEC